MEPTSINIFFTIIIGVALIAAMAGTIFPVFPGVGLAWAAAVAFGFLAEWSTLSIIFVVVISFVAGLALWLGLVVPKRSTDATGASPQAGWVAVVGGIVGAFLIPIVGFFVGGAVGVYVWESRRGDSRQDAWTATKGTLKGFGIATLIQIAAVTVISGLWMVWAGIEYVTA